MSRPKPPPLRKPATGATLRDIREEQGLTQAALAALLHVAPGTISDWETGVTTLRPRHLDRIARTFRIAPQVVDAKVASHQLLRQALRADLPIPITHELQASTWAAALSIGRTAHVSILDTVVAAQAENDRAAAARTWAKLQGAAETRRHFLIERTPGLATWALVERLAAESIEEAPDRPDTAMKLARLALRSAELAPVSEALRGCLLGYSHAHIGNAHRVAAELRASEADFVIAREWWPEGVTAPAGLLSEARLFDLEASLRRDQRQLDKALALVDRALALVPARPATGLMLLNRSLILKQQGNYHGSLEALRAATPWIDENSQPRHYTGLLFNLCVNLVDLSRFEEARELLPEVRERFLLTGTPIHRIRVSWLYGLIQEGLGDREGAIATLDQVRTDFTAKNRFIDAARAGLDLAVVYLRDHRMAETRDLARQMTTVFANLDIKREELAAVRLFLEAAEREAATVELARRAAAALRAVRRARETDGDRG
ncbi:MAG TPA: helix-turn-helix domain-containing protein [Thermoanaerobaculia bacterium]|jgi:transcriptional regulator with XRE-family HTH domain|nr:helix-turn-helix domain-containing protein [Thermoanaerobaculia bacterium]